MSSDTNACVPLHALVASFGEHHAGHWLTMARHHTYYGPTPQVEVLLSCCTGYCYTILGIHVSTAQACKPSPTDVKRIAAHNCST